MLRSALLAIGAGLLILAAVLSFRGVFVLPMAIFGAVLVLGTLFERYVYKANARARPGPGWRETGERFVDPVSGRPVTVYEKTATGERRYVDSGSAPS
jgi:hypothetical protein